MANQTPIFAVRLSAALRVKPFISSEETRYYLSGVCIDPAADGGAICAATDGHRLGAFHDREGFTSETVIVRIPNEIKLKKGLFASPWLVGVRTAPGRGHISVVEPLAKRDEDTALAAMERADDCTIRIGHAFIDGTFPDWRRVVPTPTDKDTVRGFNGEYVEAFGKAMSIRGSDPSAAHLIEIAGEPDFLGVLMPMRVDSAGKLPDWLAAPAPVKAPARKKAA